MAYRICVCLTCSSSIQTLQWAGFFFSLSIEHKQQKSTIPAQFPGFPDPNCSYPLPLGWGDTTFPGSEMEMAWGTILHFSCFQDSSLSCCHLPTGPGLTSITVILTWAAPPGRRGLDLDPQLQAELPDAGDADMDVFDHLFISEPA